MGKRCGLAAQRAETEALAMAANLPASLRLRGAGIKAINVISPEEDEFSLVGSLASSSVEVIPG
jgi:hypothetical protein